MTSIVALTEPDGGVWMAGDSRSNIGDWSVDTAVKVHRMHVGRGLECLLGMSGLGATGEVIRRRLNPSVGIELPPLDGDLDEWAHQVAYRYTELCREHGLMDGNQADGQALLGFAGRLWYITTFQALRIPVQVIGIGCGGDFAQGALEALVSWGDPDSVTSTLITRAMQVAIANDPHTGGHIRIEYLPPPGEVDA